MKVTSLLLIILTFRFFTQIEKYTINFDPPQVLLTVEVIQQTNQETQRVVEEEFVHLVAVEEMPFPIGGIQAVHDLTVYPATTKRAEIEGKVFVLA